MTNYLQAPFPWFGGKSRIAPLVWSRFGDVRNYVEPFFGSGAVLLGRPQPFAGTETVNDIDGYVANFWRATACDPEAVAEYADQPINENDLHARHIWLVNRKADFVARLEGDPDYYDAKVAGWWVWGLCCWIGGGWCSGAGPWQSVDGLFVRDAGRGVKRQLPHLGSAGQGVKRQLPHLGNAGQGVKRKLPLMEWFAALCDRLADVRVCCGDWSRVCGPTPTFVRGLTAVFLDPPYSAEAGRDMAIYAHESHDVAHDVREWAIANGDNPLMRIALCGYEGEHAMPPDWECVSWKSHGGFGNQGNGNGRENKHRERVWFSPYCLRPVQCSERGALQPALVMEGA